MTTFLDHMTDYTIREQRTLNCEQRIHIELKG